MTGATCVICTKVDGSVPLLRKGGRVCLLCASLAVEAIVANTRLKRIVNKWRDEELRTR